MSTINKPPQFEFRVYEDGDEAYLTFSEASGLETSTLAEEIDSHGAKTLVSRTASPKKNIVLRNGLNPYQGWFKKWWELCKDTTEKVRTKSIVIQLTHANGKELLQWRLTNCIPTRFSIYDVAVFGGSVHMELIELSYDEIQVKKLN